MAVPILFMILALALGIKSVNIDFNDAFPCFINVEPAHLRLRPVQVNCTNVHYSELKEGFARFRSRAEFDVKQVRLNFTADTILFGADDEHDIDPDFFANLAVVSIVIRNSDLTGFTIIWKNYETKNGFQTLKHLDLSSNSFVTFGLKDTVSSTISPDQLSDLILSNNNLEILGPIRFNGKCLDLSHNKLHSIASVAIDPQTRKNWSTEIDLSYNSMGENSIKGVEGFYITSIDTRRNLRFNFRNNNFTAIQWRPFGIIFLSTPEVSKNDLQLDFTNNPLHCDCRMKWMHEMNELEQYQNIFVVDSCPVDLNLADIDDCLSPYHPCSIEWDSTESGPPRINLKCSNVTQIGMRAAIKNNTIEEKTQYKFNGIEMSFVDLGDNGHLKTFDFKYISLTVEWSKMKSFDKEILDLTGLKEIIFQNNHLKMTSELKWFLNHNKYGFDNKTVRLNHNNISSLPVEIGMARFYDFSYNCITVLKSKTFIGCRSGELCHLNLSHNHIHEVAAKAFFYASGGIYGFQISLASNRLNATSLKENSVIFGPILLWGSAFDLSNNYLTSVETRFFFPLMDSQRENLTFMLQNNPLNCSCDMKWIIEFQNSIDFNRLKCSDGKAVSSRNHQSTNCSKIRLGYICEDLEPTICECFGFSSSAPFLNGFISKLDCSGEQYILVKELLRKNRLKINEFVGNGMTFSGEAVIEHDFFNTTTVRNVTIRNANISSVHPDLFRRFGEKKHQFFDLSNNKLISSDQLFSGISLFKGQKLDLSNNLLTNIVLNLVAFSDLNGMTNTEMKIDLSQNFIEEMREGSVIVASKDGNALNVKAHLILSSNLIKRVHRNSFRLSGANVTIELENNRLESNSFDERFLVKYYQNDLIFNLKLKYNRITFLNRRTFEGFLKHNLNVTIDIKNNPMATDCRMKWFLSSPDLTFKVNVDVNTTRLNRDIFPFCVSILEDVKTMDLGPCKLSYKLHVKCVGESIEYIEKHLSKLFSKVSFVNFKRITIMLYPNASVTHLVKNFIDSAVFKSISITNCKLQTLDRSIFGSSTRYLTHIDLSQNYINNDTNVFYYMRDMVKLQIVEIRHCFLTFVEKDSFETLPELTVLDVSNNLISIWEKQLLPLGHHSFLNIHLENNNLSFPMGAFVKDENNSITNVVVFVGNNNLTMCQNVSIISQNMRWSGEIYFMVQPNPLSDTRLIETFNQENPGIYVFYIRHVNISSTIPCLRARQINQIPWIRYFATAFGLILALVGCLIFVSNENPVSCYLNPNALVVDSLIQDVDNAIHQLTDSPDRDILRNALLKINAELNSLKLSTK